MFQPASHLVSHTAFIQPQDCTSTLLHSTLHTAPLYNNVASVSSQNPHSFRTLCISLALTLISSAPRISHRITLVIALAHTHLYSAVVVVTPTTLIAISYPFGSRFLVFGWIIVTRICDTGFDIAFTSRLFFFLLLYLTALLPYERREGIVPSAPHVENCLSYIFIIFAYFAIFFFPLA